MPASVQITIAICGTVIVLAGMFVLMVWLASKKKK
jgi:hypothetical protein